MKVTKTDGCWLWTGMLNRQGYGVFSVSKRPRVVRYAHRFMLELHGIVLGADQCACHHCDNPRCVNPSHLFVGTRTDNHADMRRKGRMPTGPRHWSRYRPDRIPQGERRGHAKLNASAVRSIRNAHSRGESIAKLAVKYGVCKQLIHGVVRRQRWRHVE